MQVIPVHPWQASPLLQQGYSQDFRIPDAWWQTTDWTPSERRRAENRAAIKRLARTQWQAAKNRCTTPARHTETYLLCLMIQTKNPLEPPGLAGEACKSLIDAGSDLHLWPDDDSLHRIATAYMQLPMSPDPTSRLIRALVMPVPWNWQPLPTIAASVYQAWQQTPPAQRPACWQGASIEWRIPSRLWITSNQTETSMAIQQQNKHARPSDWGTGKHTGILDHMREQLRYAAIPAWRHQIQQAGRLNCNRFITIAEISYQTTGYHLAADPDNAAETVMSLLEVGAAMQAIPSDTRHECRLTPEIMPAIVYTRNQNPQTQARAGEHNIRLWLLPIPKDWTPNSGLPLAAYQSWNREANQ